MNNEIKVVVSIRENETHLQEKLLDMGLGSQLFGVEEAIWACTVSKQNEKIAIDFKKGACLYFVNENAALDFLYMVICHCLYLQLINVDFGGLLGILGSSSWDNAICSTNWDERENIPYWTPVLCTNVLPDPDDEQLCFEAMDSCDNEMMERFSDESQLIMIFGDVKEEQRRLFWLEA